jgi:hypothetical protein
MALALTAVLCLFSPPFGSNALHAQEYTGPHEVKWIRVGDLRQWFADAGAEVEYGLRTRAAAQSTDQSDELLWEALYPRPDRGVSRGIWIGSTNYSDPISGDTYAFKVVQAGPKYANTLTNFIPVSFKLSGRFPHPTVVVDRGDASDNTLDDVVDSYNANQTADRIINDVTNTNMGVTVSRTIYGFSQQNHDNYQIYDYVFKNTGLLDNNGRKVDKTLTDVIFYFISRYAPGFEASIRQWATGSGISWGLSNVNQTIGLSPNDPKFEMRAQYTWYGPDSAAPLGYDADWGEPHYQIPGALGAPAFVGTVTLHADKSPSDPTDDKTQPFSTPWYDADINYLNWINSFSADQMTQQYAVMNSGHPAATHAEAVGNTFANQYPGATGGFLQTAGYGPYTMAPGDSVHVVIAEGIAGIHREQSIEIGTKWFNNVVNHNTSPLTMPDGTTTTDGNAYKKAWVWTAQDSIKEMFRRAQRVYNNNLVIPQPPPPPDNFTVSSGGDRIILKWSENADAWPHFDGYEIYRSEGRADTTYQKIFSCDKSNVVHQYDDVSANRGSNYYYYLVSKDDGTQNDVQLGTPLYSSKFYTVTNQPAYLRRPAITTTMDSIRVVPNPFHIGARSIQLDQPDKIAFYGLPPVCTIKIYTERGDLIQTLNHTNSTADELWDSITSSRQVVVSGLYIAAFETPDGRKAFRKIVIIR